MMEIKLQKSPQTSSSSSSSFASAARRGEGAAHPAPRPVFGGARARAPLQIQTRSAVPALRTLSSVIFPTAAGQLVKNPYILLSKLWGRFSQKVNLL